MQQVSKFAAHPKIIILSLALSFLCPFFAHAQETKVYYFLTDHLGSVDVVLDENGEVVERRDFLPYGAEREVSNSGTLDGAGTAPGTNPVNTRGFTGKELDSQTGLHYYGARYYDSEIGRFTSIDPVVLGHGDIDLMSLLSDPQSLNAYSYVTNNPIGFKDETGQYKEDVHYDLTLFLSRVAGLSLSQSKDVAYYNQYTDENLATMPGSYDTAEGKRVAVAHAFDGTTKKYHFADRSSTVKRLAVAMGNNNLAAFGEALHSYQDTFSHANLNILSHFLLGDTPDLTHLNTEKAMVMSKSSFELLRGLNYMTNGTNGMSMSEYSDETKRLWNEIDNSVESYLGTADKSSTNIGKSSSVIKDNKELKPVQ